jgi:hypothetical protein
MFQKGDLVYACLRRGKSGLLIFPHDIGIVVDKRFLRITKVLFRGKMKPRGCFDSELIKVDDPQVWENSTRYFGGGKPIAIEEIASI